MPHKDMSGHSAPTEPQDPRGWAVLLEKFMQAMAVRNFSKTTIDNRRRFLSTFIAWAEERGLSRPGQVTKPILERYQRQLYHRRKKNGEPLSFQSQHAYLTPLRAWFKWLSKHNHILYNPASDLELPKLEQRLPKHVLTAPEAEQVLNLPDPTEPMGVRDRAIMETFYSTGIRRMELIQLSVYDLDRQRGTLTVRQGKGKKDRTVPIGDRALAWIDRYTHEVRPGLLIGDAAGDTLFLTQFGAPFTLNRMTELVGDYILAAEMGKKGACHLFRHTMATLMLENGADIRFIQEMLGHARLSTTEIYTRVSIKKLKEVHEATHPAHLKRPANEAEETDAQPGNSAGAVVTKFAYDGWNNLKSSSPVGNENFDVWADLDDAGSLITRYVRGDAADQLFARIADNGDTLWNLTDQLGSVRDVIDNTGAVLDTITYDAFGNFTESDPEFGGRYKWTSREFDAETGFQFNRARYYDAETGRWISQDPLGFDAGDSNLYRYVNNRPTIETDPSGLQQLTLPQVNQLVGKPLSERTMLQLFVQYYTAVADGNAKMFQAIDTLLIPSTDNKAQVNDLIIANMARYIRWQCNVPKVPVFD